MINIDKISAIRLIRILVPELSLKEAKAIFDIWNNRTSATSEDARVEQIVNKARQRDQRKRKEK
jgi:ribosomal protein L7/L12